jgi:cyanophycinase
MSKGYLVLIGGAEDRRNERIILKELVGLNNAKTAVIIPTASTYPAGLGQDYQNVFRDLGVENCYVFDIRDRAEAGKTEYLEKLENADLIFFTGGDQVRLCEVFLNSALLEKIRQKHAEGSTIGGTSAGAAAASDPILFDGDNEGLVKGTIGSAAGFGFVKGVTFDTHFDERSRIARLTQFLCSGKSSKGIGLGEDTAIILSPDDNFKVLGSGQVTIMDAESIDHSNYRNLPDKQMINVSGIRIGFLHSGCTFSLGKWKII